jgi:uncharacterized protein YndB with AHSA1/START domain
MVSLLRRRAGRDALGPARLVTANHTHQNVGAVMELMRTDLMIRAPRGLVWETLADLEGVSAWNPAIDSAECISDQRTGVGARRRCYMHPSGWMIESVSEWEPQEVIAFTIDNAPPIKTGLGRFVLTDDATETRLQASFDYEVRFGPLGPVIDRLVVHRQLSSAWNQAMEGLRRHVQELINTDP